MLSLGDVGRVSARWWFGVEMTIVEVESSRAAGAVKLRELRQLHRCA